MMELYSVISKLNTPEECRAFFEDLCSPAELTAMENRWQTAKLLSRGNTYQEIIDEVKVSSVIVSRVNRVLNYGNGSLRSAAEDVGA